MKTPRVRIRIVGDHNIVVERGRVDVNEGTDFLNPDNDQAQTLLLVMLLEELQELRSEVSKLRKDVQGPL